MEYGLLGLLDAVPVLHLDLGYFISDIRIITCELFGLRINKPKRRIAVKNSDTYYTCFFISSSLSAFAIPEKSTEPAINAVAKTRSFIIHPKEKNYHRYIGYHAIKLI